MAMNLRIPDPASNTCQIGQMTRPGIRFGRLRERMLGRPLAHRKLKNLSEDLGDFAESDEEGDGGNEESVPSRASVITNHTQKFNGLNDQPQLTPNSINVAPSLENLLYSLSLEKPNFLQFQPAASTAKSNSQSASSAWICDAFHWEPTTWENYVIDEGSTEAKPIMLYVSKMKLIEKLTTILDYKLMDDFLITMETIIEPEEFAKILLSRLAQAFSSVPGWHFDEFKTDPEVVKMRGLIILQHWANLEKDHRVYPMDICRIVIEGLDYIWQYSPNLSASDRRFIIRIRRLFDPRNEISFNQEEGFTEEPRVIFNDSFESSRPSRYCTDSSLNDFSDNQLEREIIKSPSKWRERLKRRLKALFTSKPSIARRPENRASISSSLLVNSFTSEQEQDDNALGSIILSERSRTLASILSILESDIFHAINRVEIVRFPKARESPQTLAEKCPHLQRSIDHFNSMCRWFSLIVTAQENASLASELLGKLVRLAVKCILLHNYNSALQIILALQSPMLAGKTELWARLPAWERRLARDLAIFGSPARNFRNVRRALDDVCGEEVAVVPFTGLLLSDLVMNWERPDDKAPHNSKPLIPFYKCHVAAKITRQFLIFQQDSHRFARSLKPRERQLYSYFTDIGSLGGEFADQY